jgi:hypothetical protein
MKEKWFAVSGVWTKTSEGKETTILKQKIYDDVANTEEALGKFTNECVNGTIAILNDYSLMLWHTVTFLVPKEPQISSPSEDSFDELSLYTGKP